MIRLTMHFSRAGCARSVPVGPTGVSECFIDEAACKPGVDPVAFRLRSLFGTGRRAGTRQNAVGGATRQDAVGKRLSEKASCGNLELPADGRVSFATTFALERDMPTGIACVALVHVDRKSGVVRPERLTTVVDVGAIEHSDGPLAYNLSATEHFRGIWAYPSHIRRSDASVQGMVATGSLMLFV